MKKFIVTTTIHKPSIALLLYSLREDWELIIVSDLKTPHAYFLNMKCLYLFPDFQDHFYKDLSDAIGWNCIQRRNIGILEAYKRGADIVALVDDDNSPHSFWDTECFIGEGFENFWAVNGNHICLDPISIACNSTKVPSHRGYPIELQNKRGVNTIVKSKENNTDKVHIQANMWDGDWDIDALSRIEYNEQLKFPVFEPFYCKQFSPFNSQNTMLSREVLSKYFLFPHIGRMDDIWASYYVEACGYKPVYAKSTVYQHRNKHDLLVDITNEYMGYKNNMLLLEALSENPDNIKHFLPQQSWDAFQIYREYFDDKRVDKQI